LLFLFQGLKTGKISFFIVSGIFLGGAVYTYNTFFLFIVTVLLFFGGLILTSEEFDQTLFRILNFFTRRRRWRRGRRNRNDLFKLPLSVIFGFFVAFFVVAYPMMHFILKHPQKFFSHFQMNNVFHDAERLNLNNFGLKLQFILQRFFNSWKVLFQPGKIDGVDGYGIQAVLNPVVGCLFIGGIVFVLLRLREKRYQLIFLMVLIGSIAVTFSTSWHGQYRRWVGAVPVLFLIPAIFLDALLSFFENRGWRKVGIILLLFPLGWGAFNNVETYFRETPSHTMVKWVYCYNLVQALNYIKHFDLTKTKIYFFSRRWSYNYETRRFLLSHIPGEDRSHEFGNFRLDINSSESSVVFLLLSPYNKIIPQLKEMYPGGQFYELIENGQFIFATYYYKNERFRTMEQP
jgi:hypothetical protein